MMKSPALATGCLLLATLTLRAEPVFETDAMTDDELRRYRQTKLTELRQRARESRPEKLEDGTLVYRWFYGTVYYTPMESGFTAERGFDATPVTAPGLGGHKFPRAFLRAVRKEGFGRMITPIKDRAYLRYAGDGRYAFATTPLGNRGNALVPRQSAAASRRNPTLLHGVEFVIESPSVEAVFGSKDWRTADTGGGIDPLQIDLYWGEDEPMGPAGREPARPRGTRLEYAFDIVVKVRKR
jgi:hypothetical protein